MDARTEELIRDDATRYAVTLHKLGLSVRESHTAARG